jgi:hypothetical protein
MVFPIIIGRGKRLFPGELKDPAKLTLTGSTTAVEGVLLLAGGNSLLIRRCVRVPSRGRLREKKPAESPVKKGRAS